MSQRGPACQREAEADGNLGNTEIDSVKTAGREGEETAASSDAIEQGNLAFYLSLFGLL